MVVTCGGDLRRGRESMCHDGAEEESYSSACLDSKEEAIGIFINQLPGCRQGMILAPKRGHYCPAAGPLALRHFGGGQRRPSRCETLTTTARSGKRRASRTRRAQREYGAQRAQRE